jgi:thiol-disulfide isomerase/thioredoxin
LSVPAVLLVSSLLATGGGPVVYDVPSAGPSLVEQRRAVFVAAPFRVEEGKVVREEWRSSDEVLGAGTTHVVVVASWCPACKKLLSRLARARTPGAPLVLFLEDEVVLLEARARGSGAARPRGPRSSDPVLRDAPSLEDFPLQLWLLRSGSPLGRRVTHYPFHLSCTRDACRPAK